MKKDHLYLHTFIGLSIIIVVISYFSMNALFEIATNHFLRSQIETSKREANEISNLIHYQLKSGISKDRVIENVQKSIEETNPDSGFISVLDWSGILICHPQAKHVGKQILPDESFLQPISTELKPNDFYKSLKAKTEGEKATDSLTIESKTLSNGNKSEVIYLYPIEDTDWIVAAHADIESLKGQMATMKINFALVYIASGILIVLLSLFMVRLVSRRYEKNLEMQNEGLSKEVVSLSILNRNLVSYKAKVEEEKTNLSESTSKNTNDEETSGKLLKKRILTYVKDVIVAIDTQEISFIYTENAITYICCLDGKIYNYNSSLEELYRDLDNAYFFRANRQFILSINAIDKIYKYGNSQLKIEITPKQPIDIIVSKNKASEFKQWLSS